MLGKLFRSNSNAIKLIGPDDVFLDILSDLFADTKTRGLGGETFQTNLVTQNISLITPPITTLRDSETRRSSTPSLLFISWILNRVRLMDDKLW
ncbi:unnamed protein product [Thlaspi arvense]|uniref:Uncharacterized protein n=1 Tax=Thlaspi arvense TaxID=13288 RepID=A0AAU9STA9_THLAR|nr:unnamed protein product [Thlaspi arvense]